MSILKILIGIFIIIGLVAAGIYYTGSKKEGLVLNTEIRINGSVSENETIATIENITGHFEPHSQISLPTMSKLETPGVVVVVLYKSHMIGLWTSVPYKGTGVYNVIVGLGARPNHADMVTVNVRVIDKKGNNIDIRNQEIKYEPLQ